MNDKIPEGVRSAFLRTEHPFFMWEGINDLSLGADDILSSQVRDQVVKAAQAINGKKSINFIGCGTSYFAGIAATYAFHSMTLLTSFAHNAFEYLAYPQRASKDNVLVGISHTGGTPVVIDAIKLAKQRGEVTVGYTDVDNSALARVADFIIQSSLGVEPALPKTRSFIAALMRGYLLAVELAKIEGNESSYLESQLLSAPDLLTNVLNETKDQAQSIAEEMKTARKMIVVGGGPQWAIAQEGALKLTEAALTIADAWELEEAVHGTWASTNEDDLIIILAMNGPSFEKSAILADGMKTIGAKVWIITNNYDAKIDADYITKLPDSMEEIFMPLLSVVPLYYFTYFTSLAKGLRPDNMNLIDPRFLKARQMMRTSIK